MPTAIAGRFALHSGLLQPDLARLEVVIFLLTLQMNNGTHDSVENLPLMC